MNPLCLPEKLISKHAPLKSEHEIYRSTRGLNPGSSDRPSRSVRTVSQPTEPSRQALAVVRRSQIFSPRRRPHSRGRRTAKILSAGDGHYLYLQNQFGKDRCMQFRVIAVTHPQTHRQDRLQYIAQQLR